MAIYAIGDIQGCFTEFQQLLALIKFSPKSDKLWLAGDLVSRGPDSAKVLEYVYNHKKRIKIVLGNHDLHLLASYYAPELSNKKHPDLDAILALDKGKKILSWLRKQPLARFHKKHNTLMTHAGLPAQWDVKKTLKHAQEVEDVLAKKSSAIRYFQTMYGNKPDLWHDQLQGADRLRYITNALTRMRFCYTNGRLDFKTKSSDSQDSNLVPWFELQPKDIGATVVFGHWAALEGKCPHTQIEATDTGCVWGGSLTALRLKDKKRFQVTARLA